MTSTRIKTVTICSIFTTLSLVALNAYAATDPNALSLQIREESILKVTTDTMGGATQIKLTVDDDSNILSLREYTADGKVIDFDLNQLASGAVLMSSDGRNVITLRFNHLNSHSGGRVTMVYLTNGILNRYSNFEMNLLNTPNGWTLEVDDRQGRRSISTMFLQGKRFFGKVIGIDRVVVN